MRITINEIDGAMELRLEGRVAGAWAAELGRFWAETAPRLNSRKLFIDLHNVTYADESGKQILKTIYAQTDAALVASTPWTQHLAAEIAAKNTEDNDGKGHATNA